MGIGAWIRALRLKAGLTQKELAAQIGISQNHMSQLEMGKRRVDADWIPKIAQALKCRPEDIVSDTSQKPNHDISRITENIIFIPLLSDVTKACCGMGNGYEFPDGTIERRIPVDLDALGPIRTAGLFSCKVEGDSMTGAKIYDGDIVIVAPEEEPMSGNVVLVCYGPQMKWMIRWFYTKSDGTIVLKAANRDYPDIEVTPEDVEWAGMSTSVKSSPTRGRHGMEFKTNSIHAEGKNLDEATMDIEIAFLQLEFSIKMLSYCEREKIKAENFDTDHVVLLKKRI